MQGNRGNRGNQGNSEWTLADAGQWLRMLRGPEAQMYADPEAGPDVDPDAAEDSDEIDADGGNERTTGRGNGRGLTEDEQIQVYAEQIAASRGQRLRRLSGDALLAVYREAAQTYSDERAYWAALEGE